jgi:hypothetical protein
MKNVSEKLSFVFFNKIKKKNINNKTKVSKNTSKEFIYYCENGLKYIKIFLLNKITFMRSGIINVNYIKLSKNQKERERERENRETPT